MNFEWDDLKEAENIRKHGVDFWEAQTAFFDSLAKQYVDPHPKEERFILIGQSARPRLLLVVFVEMNGDVVRIVSARKPTAKEKKKYEEGI